MFNQITRNVFKKKLKCSPLVVCIHFSLSSRFLARSRIHDTIKRRVGGVDLLSLSPRALFFLFCSPLILLLHGLATTKIFQACTFKDNERKWRVFSLLFYYIFALEWQNGATDQWSYSRSTACLEISLQKKIDEWKNERKGEKWWWCLIFKVFESSK